ncbi:cyclase dehydrase [Bradyrhizobium sp. 190]|uniref:cyclase dehydrase n=1 Tax=Bradyrhizobium sp. 190 TaxID=2782658 RepID=UPI001FF9E770|nr:cyclase dehydrase [Bradyrhizobium sp. 190]MCK1518388.1 cyclase dehydrase [Bradyrhizobium sp. 190]
MHDVVRRSALPGRSQSSHDKMARGLGYFSLALGIAELVAPGAICRAAGVKGLETVVRGYGAREIATGIAILGSHDPEPWIWTRVAGDLADIATVATGVQQDNQSKGRSTLALATLAAVTLIDLACANGLNAEKGNRKTAIRDYSRRSGFPKGLQAASGAARDFQIPDDMRTPELLRPWDRGGGKA